MIIDEKLSSIRIISLALLATSVAVLVAKPTSALTKAGASLVPSAVTATTSSDCYKAVTKSNLSEGLDLERTLS